MVLSLYMLSERLKEYSPEMHIREGKRSISTVRIIADDLSLSSSTVYLHQMDAHRVFCSNGQDFMILQCDDINMVLNSILDAFEYYNDWANELTRQIKSGCTIETVLEAGHKLLQRYLVLADPTFLIYQTYGPEQLLQPFPLYKKALKEKMLPLDVLMMINQENAIRIPELPSYEVAVPSMKINTIVSNLFSYSSHNGWLITHNTSCTYSQSEKDLQDAYAELLQTWLAFNESTRQKTNREEVFRNLLDGKEPGENDLNRLAVFHWMPNDVKQVYVISADTQNTNIFYAIIRSFERFNPSGFIFLYGEELVYIVNCMLIDEQEHERNMINVLSQSSCLAGRSERFTSLGELQRHYNSAKVALKYKQKKAGPIIDLNQSILPYLSSLITQNSVFQVRHPIIEILNSYDEKHSAQLCETLRVFLENKCSYEKTRNELFIHRSTLLYRISRIQELTGFDPDDYETCLQLEISFMLDKYS